MHTLHVLAVLALAGLIPAQKPEVHTSRPAGKELIKLPKEDEAFGFVIYGDRTAGPPEGVKILAQAVADTNLLDPDLVMTVGDLVQGYNDAPAWQKQAAEYKSIMQGLRMPWFPVAGNHDIYWRGQDKPKGEHERDFETTFGPLWYAFPHKNCWFVVLYSDEGNKDSGIKDFTRPDCQRISDEQFAWLQETLQKAKGARHVFVFLHHPRWLTARYGDDWDKVHKALVAAGNVHAVFAGHIHRMRYDGVRDGIQYFTLAAIGGSIDMDLPQAGFLHEMHVVTVRPEGIQVAMLPVGTVMDPKLITGEVSEDAAALHDKLKPDSARGLDVKADGSAGGVLEIEFHNPARRPIELLVEPRATGQWSFQPDHAHAAIAAGGKATVTFVAARGPGTFDLPEVELRCDYLGQGVRFSLPRARHTVPLRAPVALPVDAGARGCLQLDGKGSCLELASDQLALPDGPFTVEAWFDGTDFKGRRALLAKAESSEWAVFVSNGELEFQVHIDGKYAHARSKQPVLEAGGWHHTAGVFDGRDLRIYLDGTMLDVAKARGQRTPNQHPLFIGADPGRDGRPGSFFSGLIDEVRISRIARYGADPFTPERRFVADGDTVLLLHLDQDFGPWTPDSSSQHAHAQRRGAAACVPEETAVRKHD